MLFRSITECRSVHFFKMRVDNRRPCLFSMILNFSRIVGVVVPPCGRAIAAVKMVQSYLIIRVRCLIEAVGPRQRRLFLEAFHIHTRNWCGDPLMLITSGKCDQRKQIEASSQERVGHSSLY